ncbi:hypothetical protein EI94DRAFT_1755040 [Lactarius quietus]|nr:hypothetical protein EI94DRAFT_1755040 [Lactarius quietus]
MRRDTPMVRRRMAKLERVLSIRWTCSVPCVPHPLPVYELGSGKRLTSAVISVYLLALNCVVGASHPRHFLLFSFLSPALHLQIIDMSPARDNEQSFASSRSRLVIHGPSRVHLVRSVSTTERRTFAL